MTTVARRTSHLARFNRVLIWGFGRHGGGLAAARFCAARGATVTILDAKPRSAFGALADEVDRRGWAWEIGDGSHPALQATDLIVASPAIPPRAWPKNHPPMIGPEGLFCADHRGPLVAVTGTKGKSTTARILGTLLGWEVAGNSYEPLLEMQARVGVDAPLVCELSSFQLHYLSTATALVDTRKPGFSAAIVTSLAVDHLDWHPDLDHYHRAKLSVLNRSPVAALADDVAARAAALGIATPPTMHTVTYHAGRFVMPNGTVIAERGDLPVLGDHNARNAALAITVALHLGVPSALIAERLRMVQPLPHRLETVHTAAGIRFVNDSIATTPEAAMAGIASFAGPLAVILGGSDKGATWAALAALIATRSEHQPITPIVIGQTGPAIAAALQAVGITAQRAITLDDAVTRAIAALPTGGSVLLTPACASFDMFHGFEDRGRQFAASAKRLR